MNENKSIFTGITSRDLDFLSNLIKHSFLYGLTSDKEKIQIGCIYTISEIFKKPVSDLFNLTYLGDYFFLFVYLCCSMPYLFYDDVGYSFSNSLDIKNLLEIFKMILQFHCIQIIFNKIVLNVDFDASSENEASPKEEAKLGAFYRFVLDIIVKSKQIPIDRKYLSASTKSIISTLKRALMPFLRCSALFLYCLNDFKVISSTLNIGLGLVDQSFDNLIQFFDLTYDRFLDLFEIHTNGYFKILSSK